MGIVIGVVVFLVLLVGHLHYRVTKMENLILMMASNLDTNNYQTMNSVMVSHYMMFRMGHLTDKQAIKMLNEFKPALPEQTDYFIDLVKETQRYMDELDRKEA